LTDPVVAAMLGGKKLPNKGFIGLWLEDLRIEVGLELFGVYQHDFKVYLIKAKVSDLIEVIKVNGGRSVSTRLLEYLIK
jgi:hypothetical protein